MNKSIDMAIKAILSDGGSILFNDRSTKRAEYEFLVDNNVEIDYDDFTELFADFKELAQTKEGYSQDNAFVDYLNNRGMDHLVQPYLDKIQNKPKGKKKKTLSLTEGVPETLREIKNKGVDFIVLTDSTKPAKKLWGFLDNANISDYITDMISSKDLGVKKPHADFFRKVMDDYGLDRSEVVFLAHDYDELSGAHNLGYEVLAFNYDPKDDLSFIPDSNKLENFSDLLKFLDYRNK